MSVSAPPLLPLLRSRVQGDILAWTYLHPESEYTLTDLARHAASSVRAVHHEVERLVATGLLHDRRHGNLRLVRANTDTVVARPLTDLLAVTFGPLPILTQALAAVEGIDEAYLYGSWAARYSGEVGPVPNDVDVLVVGLPDVDLLDTVARSAGDTLGREVAITRIRPSAWLDRADATGEVDPFLVSLLQRPLVRLHLIDEHDDR